MLLTDQPNELVPLRASVERNAPLLKQAGGAAVEVEALRWGAPIAGSSSSGSSGSGSNGRTDGRMDGWTDGLDVVLASDVTYVHEALDELAATLAALLALSPPPRIILAHEHRDKRRDFGRALARGAQWDAHDAALAAFTAAAAQRGLVLTLLDAERPTAETRGEWRRWTADVSIVQLSLS